MYTPPKSYVMHEHVRSVAYFNAKHNAPHWSGSQIGILWISMFSVFWRYFWPSHSMFDLKFKTNLGRFVQPFLDVNKLYYFTLQGWR